MAKNRMSRGGMPRGNMGGVNMNQLMQQAKKMQEQLAQAQDKAKELEVSASAGGGMVKVVASGDMQLKSIAIDPEALDPDDVELLQDMILAAVNDALNSASEAANSEVASATGLGGMDLGGMGIPGLF
ncbi:YbaB/EbfC family nucleoid-associated protein [Coriobacteriaceae bacterium]|uniref:Nucleoid-associated protein ATOP_17000 n=1 Tax=Granulimonas faecalis TaxID=2894155 RepID=A0AAV5B382_9ACTN|nr:YbaB/EbfC family nucleoid-associated protein [Coriobacteriaceae bacterium]GJM56045.1 nucleoid-associated protein [Granulimonas faecalis]